MPLSLRQGHFLSTASHSRKLARRYQTEDLVNLGVQLTFQITLIHPFQGDRLDLRSVACGTEGFVTGDAHVAHGSHGGAEEFTWVEFARVGGHQATHRTGGRQAQVGVDIDLAHAVLDALDDFLNRYAVGLFNVAAVLVDDRQPLLRNRRRAVHHQVSVRNALVDLFDAVDRQYIAGRRFGELVGAVAGADGDGQGIDLGALDEVSGFFRVGQHLAMVQNAFGADSVFFTGHAGFQRTQAAQLAFYRYAAGVSHGHGLLSNAYVVVVVGRGLAVFAKGAVHHHRAEAQLDGTLADVRAGAVVLVHAHRDVREFFDGRQDQVTQERCAGVFASTGRSLDDHRGVSLVSGFHDGAHLLKVVDVEGWNAVAELGCVVQHLAHADKCHCVSLSRFGSLIVPACRSGGGYSSYCRSGVGPGLRIRCYINLNAAPTGTAQSVYCALQPRPIKSLVATQ